LHRKQHILINRLLQYFGHDSQNLRLRLSKKNQLSLFDELGMAYELEDDFGPIARPYQAGGVV